MSFRRTTLESERDRFTRPVAAPIEDVMIQEMMRRRLALNGHGFEFRVIPNQRPEILCVNLPELFEPLGHTLGRAALEALGHSVEQVVIRVEVSLRMRPRILCAFARASQWSLEDVAEIKHIISVR